MEPIEGGSWTARIRAEEAARQAAEEAARQAAAEAARKAAEEARRQALLAREERLDRIETRTQVGPFTSTASTAPTAATTDPTYSPQALQLLEEGGLSEVPPAGGNLPPAPDPFTDLQAQQLLAVFAAAEQAWASLPPDLQTVTVRPGDDPQAIVAAWEQAGQIAIGPGNPDAYEAYLQRNQLPMAELALAFDPESLTAGQANELLVSGHSTQYANRLVLPALEALAEQYPDASFALLAVEDGVVPLSTAGPTPFAGHLVIEMTNGGEVQHFALDVSRLMSPYPDDPIFTTLAQQPDVLAAWSAELQPGAIPASVLEDVASSYHPSMALDALVAMPPEAQAAFLQAYGLQPASEAAPFGLLKLVPDIGADEVIVRVDATALAKGEQGVSLQSQISVEYVEGLDKVANFISANYETVVAPAFAQFLALRGDEPRTLGGTDLINEIGVAMHLPPNHVPQTEQEMQLLLAGKWELYTGDALDIIGTVADQIETVAGSSPASVATLPVTYFSEQTGLVQLPLFRVDGPGGQDVFVDNEGREYESFDAWRTENRLPPGQFTYPAGGHLQPGANGGVLTVTATTPRTVDTIQEWALQAGDTVALVGGFVVLAGAVVGSGGALLPVTAAALAAWGGARSFGNLLDRAEHGQTLSLANPEARAEWLNLGASVLGIAALGSGSLARALAQGGSRYASAATNIARLTHLGAEVTDAITMGDLAQSFFTNSNLTTEDRLMIVAQLAFWGGQSLVVARSDAGLYSLESAEWRLAAAAANAEGRPLLPPESGLTPRFEAAVKAAIEELGLDALGFRGSTPGASFWHDVGGPTQRDSWKVVENFLAGEGTAPGAYVPTKPEGAITLAKLLPDGTADLTNARALDAYLRQEVDAGLLDVFPQLEGIILTDSTGQIVGLQPMLGGAVPVVMNPVKQTITLDGTEVTVPVGQVGITVSDFDLVYAVKDGQPLTEQQVREQLIPAINRYYSSTGYDVVNHPDHATAMLDPDLNEQYGLSNDPGYWQVPVYSFDALGYTGEGPLGPTVQRMLNLPPEWRGGPRPQ